MLFFLGPLEVPGVRRWSIIHSFFISWFGVLCFMFTLYTQSLPSTTKCSLGIHTAVTRFSLSLFFSHSSSPHLYTAPVPEEKKSACIIIVVFIASFCTQLVFFCSSSAALLFFIKSLISLHRHIHIHTHIHSLTCSRGKRCVGGC